MIWGADVEVKHLETQNKICSAMYDHEKATTLLSRDVKIELAECAQVTMSDVEDVQAKHKQLQNFHNWLITRKENDEPMP